MTGFVEEWEVRLGAGLAAFSRRYPDIVYSARPLGFRWAIRCSGPPESLAQLRESSALRAPRTEPGARSDSSFVFTYGPTSAEVSLIRKLAEAGGFVLPPMVVRQGEMRVRLLVEGRSGTGPAPAGAFPMRLVSRRRLTAARLEEELERQAPGIPRLTPRQSEVLLEAVRSGYYEVPRRANVMTIARTLSLGRSTAEEHLRAAESAVIRSAAPLVEMSRSAGAVDGGEPVAHFARYSSELELYVDLTLRGDRVAQVRLLRSAPRSRVVRDHPLLSRILEHIRTGADDLRDVPVDLDVSPFERGVLEELRRIPPGETRTYSEIARRLGRPGAARAVGNACSHNPAVVVIPCHRVVPSHGGIGRYSATGGTATKARLLLREGAVPRGPQAEGGLSTGSASSLPSPSRHQKKRSAETPERTREGDR